MNFLKYRPVGEASATENYSIITDLTAQSNLSNKKLFKKQSVYHYVLSWSYNELLNINKP